MILDCRNSIYTKNKEASSMTIFLQKWNIFQTFFD